MNRNKGYQLQISPPLQNWGNPLYFGKQVHVQFLHLRLIWTYICPKNVSQWFSEHGFEVFPLSAYNNTQFLIFEELCFWVRKLYIIVFCRNFKKLRCPHRVYLGYGPKCLKNYQKCYLKLQKKFLKNAFQSQSRFSNPENSHKKKNRILYKYVLKI